MSALKKPVSALIGVVAMLLAGVFFLAGTANAVGGYPPGTTAKITVSDTTPAAGQSISVDGTGFQPGEEASVEFHSVVVTLGAATVDGSGAFSTSVTIPSNASGAHEIVATGLTSGSVASVAIEVGSTGTGTGTGSGSGSGLAGTGVAVIGIGALGVVLLVGGGLMLLAGKRHRKVSI